MPCAQDNLNNVMSWINLDFALARFRDGKVQIHPCINSSGITHTGQTLPRRWRLGIGQLPIPINSKSQTFKPLYQAKRPLFNYESTQRHTVNGEIFNDDVRYMPQIKKINRKDKH